MAADEIVTKDGAEAVGPTVQRLRELLAARGLTIFGVIDQQAEARRVGLDLRETVLVLFGNPRAGTPVMDAAPLAALDLPLKILIWADGTRSRLSFLAPDALAARYGLEESLVAPLRAIDALTDALAQPAG